MAADTTGTLASRHCTVALIACICAAPAAQAQVRGLPLFFDPLYSYQTRAGADVGDGGELGGVVWAVGASHLFATGNCDGLALSVAGGAWHPSGDRPDGLNLGATASYLLSPCPEPLSAPNPTYRVVAGGGLTRADGRSVMNVPLGAQLGYMFEWGVVRLEPWTTARAHYLESPVTEGESTWRLGLSVGLNIGVASVAGGRAAADFGTGRVGFGGGLSLWF
jgi:hypothetical protein